MVGDANEVDATCCKEDEQQLEFLKEQCEPSILTRLMVDYAWACVCCQFIVLVTIAILVVMYGFLEVDEVKERTYLQLDHAATI